MKGARSWVSRSKSTAIYWLFKEISYSEHKGAQQIKTPWSSSTHKGNVLVQDHKGHHGDLMRSLRIRCNTIPFHIKHSRDNAKVFRGEGVVRQLNLQGSTREMIKRHVIEYKACISCYKLSSHLSIEWHSTWSQRCRCCTEEWGLGPPRHNGSVGTWRPTDEHPPHLPPDPRQPQQSSTGPSSGRETETSLLRFSIPKVDSSYLIVILC